MWLLKINNSDEADAMNHWRYFESGVIKRIFGMQEYGGLLSEIGNEQIHKEVAECYGKKKCAVLSIAIKKL
ncbi:MAG: hypothetical protein R2824_02075 [Saprospiraceae bacterium]|nr:hypothetical protein [Lewinella sp.]